MSTQTAAVYPKDTLLGFPRPVKTYHTEQYPRILSSCSTFDGAGKTLLITGGATGIGLEITRAFATAGIARICIVSRREDVLAKAKTTLSSEYPNLNIDTYGVSVADFSAIDYVVAQVRHVDVVVLAAAYAHAHDAVQDIPLKGMQDSYNTNVIGNWNLVNAVLKTRTASSGQAIILNVSSFAAYRTLPRQSAYGPSKGAFSQIMSEFATEYKESDARFVSFHPGAIWTDLKERGFGSKDIFEGWEDVTLPGHFAVWLASPEADFLHGRFVWAQWDVDELIELQEKIGSDPYALKLGLSQVV